MVALQKLTFRQKLILSITIAFVMVIVLVGINYWLMMKISTAESQIQEKRQKLVARSRIVENETILRIDLKKAEQEKEFLNNVLPLAEELLGFSKEIDLWAKQNNIEARFNFSPETPGNGLNPGFIPFTIGGLAPSINNIFSLVKTMELSSYIIKFNQYSISGDGSRYNFSINGQIFSR